MKKRTTRKVKLTPVQREEAERELDEAYEWYERRRLGLGLGPVSRVC